MDLLEQTLSEIAKPQWEGAPGFGHAWDEVCRLVGDPRLASHAKWLAGGLRRLAEARVVTLSAEQMQALPPIAGAPFDGDKDEGMLLSAMRRVTLPWEHVYLDIPPNPWRVAGGLASQHFSPKWGRNVLHIVVFSHYESRVLPIGVVREAPQPSAWLLPTSDMEARLNAVGVERGAFQASAVKALHSQAERQVAIFQWLESVNVEVVDQPVSRQVRRNAERKGAEIAKVVRVRLPKSWRNGAPPRRAGAIEFSHRFEVRGHYKFFPESTRLAQAAPEKLSWVPERDGYFRRVWCPPFVKGPADKPLVPKTRQLVAA